MAPPSNGPSGSFRGQAGLRNLARTKPDRLARSSRRRKAPFRSPAARAWRRSRIRADSLGRRRPPLLKRVVVERPREDRRIDQLGGVFERSQAVRLDHGLDPATGGDDPGGNLVAPAVQIGPGRGQARVPLVEPGLVVTADTAAAGRALAPGGERPARLLALAPRRGATPARHLHSTSRSTLKAEALAQRRSPPRYATASATGATLSGNAHRPVLVPVDERACEPDRRRERGRARCPGELCGWYGAVEVDVGVDAAPIGTA
jgi:hypothetical protein